MNAALQQRLRFIDFLLDHYGFFNRAMLADYCGIAPSQATRDIRAYRDAAPGNLALENHTKLYRRSSTYARIYP